MLPGDEEPAEEEAETEEGRSHHGEAEPGHDLVAEQVQQVRDHQLAEGQAPADPGDNLRVHHDLGLTPLEAGGQQSRETNLRKEVLVSCGSVGRAVASDTRDLRLESQHWQNFNLSIVWYKKTKIKKKRPG